MVRGILLYQSLVVVDPRIDHIDCIVGQVVVDLVAALVGMV
jgi:hypothetical protein